MADRERTVANAGSARTAPSSRGERVTVRPPTADQEEYLKSVKLSTDDYDPQAVIGGRRVLR